MSGSELDASVVIPSYNNRETLIPCIQRLADQTHPAERYEVVVVLDGAIDGSRAALAELRVPMALRVFEQPNGGRASAINHGAREARGRIMIVTDGDILVNREFVASHVVAHTGDDIVIGPIPLAPESPMSFLTDGVEEWAEEHTRSMLSRTGTIGLNEIYGANWSGFLADFRRVGGHREDIRRGEDWELGKKFIDAGLSIKFCATAIAAQIYDKTIHGWANDFYVDGQSYARMVREFPEVRSSMQLAAYEPMTLAKRLLRTSVIRQRPLGKLFVWTSRELLELARRRGLRWKILGKLQGLLGDCLYFRGVYDAVGDWDAFLALVRSR